MCTNDFSGSARANRMAKVKPVRTKAREASKLVSKIEIPNEVSAMSAANESASNQGQIQLS